MQMHTHTRTQDKGRHRDGCAYKTVYVIQTMITYLNALSLVCLVAHLIKGKNILTLMMGMIITEVVFSRMWVEICIPQKGGVWHLTK